MANGLILVESIIKRTWEFISKNYNLNKYVKDKLTWEERHAVNSALSVFFFASHNMLLVRDKENFWLDQGFDAKEVQKIMEFALDAITKFYWNLSAKEV